MRLTTWHRLACAGDSACRGEMARYFALRRRPPRYAQPAAPGHVVEFLKGGHSACGLLLRSGRRVDWILDTRGKDQMVPKDRVVHFSETFIEPRLPRHEIIAALRQVDRCRDGLKATIDVKDLWEAVEPEARGWTLQELTDLYFPGNPGPHGCAAMFRALQPGHNFSRQGQVFVPLKPAAVARWAADERRDAEADAWLHQAGAWLRAVANGTAATPPPDAETALDLLAAKVLAGARHEHAERANALAGLAHLHGWRSIFELLVKVGRWQKDENLDLLRCDTPVSFTGETIAEARAVRSSGPAGRIERLRLRNVYVFAAGRGPVERAFSIQRASGGFAATVHVATPAFAVAPGSLLQQAAAERAVSLRLPDRVIPMLPPDLTDSVSLTDSSFRPVLSVHMRFNAQFGLVSHRFELRRVRVTRRFAADECAQQVERDPALRRLFTLAQRLREQRKNAGARLPAAPEVEARSEEGRVTLHRFDPDAPDRLIDRELSMLANSLAGRLCAERGLPALYRIDSPRPEPPASADRRSPAAVYGQQRIPPRPALQTRAAANAGLGADVYASVTEPMSRYEDLLAHQQIVGLLADGSGPHSAKDLDDALRRTAYARESARDIERSSQRYWLLRHLESLVGVSLEAVVIEGVARGCLVELSETLLTAFCPLDGHMVVTPGTSLQVVLTHVSARAGTFRLRLAHARQP